MSIAIPDSSHSRPRVALLLGLVALAASLPSAAAASEEPRFVWSGEIGLVSDYRFRGLSLSDRKPALQGGLTVTHASGAYLGVWGSTYADGAGGTDVEADVYAGWATQLADGFDMDLMVTYYSYPADQDLNYFESYGTLTYAVGVVTPRLGLAYAPAQDALRDDAGEKRDNLYVFAGADLAVPSTPVTFTAEIGLEQGPYDGPDKGKWDWQVGAKAELGKVTLGLAYVDSSLARVGPGPNLGGAGVVASLLLNF